MERACLTEGLRVSNRAELINTETPAIIVAGRQCLSGQDGVRYIVVAEAANRIPVPWMCCFHQNDLRTVTAAYQTGPAEFETLTLSVPFTTTENASKNVRVSLSVFEEIAEDAEIAEQYWRLALEALDTLKFPFLTIDPLEVLLMNDPAEEAAAFSRCFDADTQARTFMKQLAFIEEGHVPYSAQQLYSSLPDELSHHARLANAAALDFGLVAPERHRYETAEVVAATMRQATRKKPWWKFR